MFKEHAFECQPSHGTILKKQTQLNAFVEKTFFTSIFASKSNKISITCGEFLRQDNSYIIIISIGSNKLSEQLLRQF